MSKLIIAQDMIGTDRPAPQRADVVQLPTPPPLAVIPPERMDEIVLTSLGYNPLRPAAESQPVMMTDASPELVKQPTSSHSDLDTHGLLIQMDIATERLLLWRVAAVVEVIGLFFLLRVWLA